MKIGNAPLPVADRTLRQQGAAGAETPVGKGRDDVRSDDGSAFKVELSQSAEQLAEGGVRTAAEAMEVASATREMVAESNREAVDIHQKLDPKKLLDLLA